MYLLACIIGIGFHYAYDLLNIPYLKAIFPSNESIFEHTKLIIFPCILVMLLDLIIYKKRNFVFSSYISGIIVAIVFMISAYYTYSGIIGANYMAVDIALFFISILIVFIYRYKKITLFEGANSVIAFVILIILVELFTFYPADINLFKMP